MWFAVSVSVFVSVIVSANRLLISFALASTHVAACEYIEWHCGRLLLLLFLLLPLLIVIALLTRYARLPAAATTYYILLLSTTDAAAGRDVCQMASHAWAIRQQGKATTNASLETFVVSRAERGEEGQLGMLRKFCRMPFASLTDCVGHTCLTNWRQREVFNGAGAAIKTADQSGQSVVKNKRRKNKFNSKWKMANVVEGEANRKGECCLQYKCQWAA